MENTQQKNFNAVDVRFWSLMTYAPIDEINIVLNRHKKQIMAAFVIEHDDEGIEKHRHILLWLRYARREDVVLSWFSHCMDENNKYVNTFAEQTKHVKESYEYLTHKNNPEKKQYDESNIICFGLSSDDYIVQKTIYEIKDYGARRKKSDCDRCLDIVDNLIAGNSMRDMISNYGRDFIINRHRYVEAAVLVSLEEGEINSAISLSSTINNSCCQSSVEMLKMQKMENLSRSLYGDPELYNIFNK